MLLGAVVPMVAKLYSPTATSIAASAEIIVRTLRAEGVEYSGVYLAPIDHEETIAPFDVPLNAV